MTSEVYTTPGSGASTRFTATVGGTAAFLHGRAVVAEFECLAWATGATVEQSWLIYGSNASTEVIISRTVGSIRTAIVYPKDAGVTQAITAGTLVLQVPTNVRLRVEIDGDRANALHVFSSPLKPALPVSYTNWTSLVKTVSNVNTGSYVWTTSTAHGLATNDKVVLASTGVLPATAGGILTPTSILSENETYFVSVLTSTTFSLIDSSGGLVLGIDDAGSGTITMHTATWTSTTTALYFGAGLATIGRLFRVGSNATIYLDGGAVVKGSFDVRASQGIRFQGRGCIDGAFATHAAAVAAATPSAYSIFLGHNGSNFTYSNTVEGLTIFNAPYYLTYEGIWKWTNVQNISPWNYNCDGLDCSEGPDNQGHATDCFMFTGDDASRVDSNWFSMNVTGCFLVNSASSAMLLSYWGQADAGNEQTVTDCHAMSLEPYDTQNHGIIRCWLDSDTANAAYGAFGVTISGLRIWGEVNARLFTIENRLYPFDVGLQNDVAGQTDRWLIEDLESEETPYQLSRLNGLNATSTPHGITFTDITLGGVVVNDGNWEDFVSQNSYPYDITLDEADALVVEDGSVVADADAYCTLAFADAYHTVHSAPVAWSGATEAARNTAIREATSKIEERYGTRWMGVRADADQQLGWPRISAIDQSGYEIDSDEIPLALQRATARAALLFIQGEELSAETQEDAAVTAETLTSASGASRALTFAGARSAETQFPALDRMLSVAGLIEAATGWGQSEV